jgi:hypothetical protein
VSIDPRADRQLVEAAAAVLRSRTSQDIYAGRVHPVVGFGMCSILDECARHWRELDDAVRRQVVQTCQVVLRS